MTAEPESPTTYIVASDSLRGQFDALANGLNDDYDEGLDHAYNHNDAAVADDDDDDDDLQNEMDRLSVTQMDLRLELLSVMRMVESLQQVDEDDNEPDGNSIDSSPEERKQMLSTPEQESLYEWTVMSTRRLDWNETSLLVVDEDKEQLPQKQDKPLPDNQQLQPTQPTTIKSQKKAFSKIFFESLLKPRRENDLQSQKRRQLHIVNENLKSIEPGLEQVADSQRKEQETLILNAMVRTYKSRRLYDKDKLKRLLQKKPRTLDEEKHRQEEILKLTEGVEFVRAMERERAAQELLLQEKKQELETTKRIMRERQHEEFWSTPRRQLNAMVGRGRDGSKEEEQQG